MRVVHWNAGRVATGDSVAVAGRLSGEALRDAYVDALSSLTLSLVRLRDNAIVLGPLTLLRFGEPNITKDAVEWPIEADCWHASRGAAGVLRHPAAGSRLRSPATGRDCHERCTCSPISRSTTCSRVCISCASTDASLRLACRSKRRTGGVRPPWMW